MWRAPKLQDIEAPPEFKKLINASIFFNRQGNLRGASQITITQYILALLFSWIFLASMVFVISTFLLEETLGSVIAIIFILLIVITTGVYFIYWGWYNYEQAWYHFNDDDEIFSVTMNRGDSWETFEIPYDTVDQVEWSGGEFGYAIIHAGGFRFPTTRKGSKRYASVTEMWPKLARFDTDMRNWPITLVCPKCEREFGHHIGTAQCPFDDLILLDPDVKGRIDPEEIHPEDKERV